MRTRLCCLLATLICTAVTAAHAAATTIAVYNLSYAEFLSPTDGFEHTHTIAALSGLANRDSPTLLVLWTPSDTVWLDYVRSPGGWLDPTSTNTSFITVESGNLSALVTAVGTAVKGVVLYDPSVPATSNVASTIAGVKGLLPIAYNPTGGPTSVYHQLVASNVLQVVTSLVGKFNGSRTGSAKCDAYLWAKEMYLDTGETNPRLLAYYVDYFAATLTPAPAPAAPAAPAIGEVFSPTDRLTQGQTLHVYVPSWPHSPLLVSCFVLVCVFVGRSARSSLSSSHAAPSFGRRGGIMGRGCASGTVGGWYGARRRPTVRTHASTHGTHVRPYL
jgi:hypothetical protein